MAVSDPVTSSEAGLAVSTVELFAALQAHHPGEDFTLVERAVEVATAAHAGQTRLSGEPYVSHSVAVATILAELGLDTTAVTAGVLHDVVEDTKVTLEEIESQFGGP